jgi:hypothetical protein
MSTFQGALVSEQGVKFAIVVVKSHVLAGDKSRGGSHKGFRAGLRRRPDRVDGAGQFGPSPVLGASRHRESSCAHAARRDSLAAVYRVLRACSRER